jgi:transposase
MLGIDASSKKLEAALCYHSQESPRWRREVPNTLTGVEELLALTPAEVPWVIEPTGRYSLFVVQRAQAAGRKVLLAPPRQAKRFLQSLQSRAKTDKLDGRGLALFGLSRPLRDYPVKSENVDQIDQLLSARKLLSRSRSSLRLQAKSLPKAHAVLAPAIEALAEQIKQLDKQIAALTTDPEQVKTYPEFAQTKQLLQVPGIGPVTAAALVSRLSAKQFSHPDQLVAYIGMDVGVRQSGQRVGYLGLTKEGDAELRRLLFVCAKAAVSGKDNPFKTQYQREKDKGLSPTAALCAVARKMACVCWSIHKHGTDYDPARVNTRPKPKTEPDDLTDNNNNQNASNQQ